MEPDAGLINQRESVKHYYIRIKKMIQNDSGRHCHFDSFCLNF